MPDFLPMLPRRRALTAAVSAVALGATALTAQASAPTPTIGTNVVVEWNRTLLSLVQTPGAQPATVHPTRDFAVMSKAVYAAVSSSSHVIGVRRISEQHAAAAQAAHDVLTSLFPAFADRLDRQLADDLAEVPSGNARAAGVQDGGLAAAEELKVRARDGSDATPPPYLTTAQPGDFRPAPPGFAAPVFTHWGAVTPFVLRSGDQFRPPAPPALSSPAYAAALNEVQSLGRDDSTTRTPEQTMIGNFWSAPIQNYWNDIADQVLVAHHAGTEPPPVPSRCWTSRSPTPRSRCTTPSTPTDCGGRSPRSASPTPTGTGGPQRIRRGPRCPPRPRTRRTRARTAPSARPLPKY